MVYTYSQREGRKMSTKESVKSFLSAKEFGNGRFNSLADLIVGQLAIKDLLDLRNNLVNDNFIKILQDEDMMNCVREFFKYDLNVAETSRKSFLHRNTLLYRLDKINKLTGLNLRSFDDAVCFKVLAQVYRLTT